MIVHPHDSFFYDSRNVLGKSRRYVHPHSDSSDTLYRATPLNTSVRKEKEIGREELRQIEFMFYQEQRAAQHKYDHLQTFKVKA